MDSATPEGQPLQEALDRVLSSATFARSDRVSKLLRFLVDRHLQGRDDELKESVIGVEVFGRKPGYDPKLDSTVRTEAVRLRARLTTYYSTEGSQDPFVIELPKGGYVPLCRPRLAVAPPETPLVEAAPRAGWWRVGGAVALLAAIAGAVAWTAQRAVPSPIYLSFVRPTGLELTNTGRPVLAMSPDGTKVVFNANNQLHVRRLAAAESEPIAGTQGSGVRTPFFSPDGRWVAFFSAKTNELKRVPVDGGAAVTICRPPAGDFGATWTPDNHVVFATADGVFRVSANGGTPQRIIDARPGETLFGPQMLPDNDHVLLTVTTSTGLQRWDDAQVVAQSLSSGARTVLIEAGADARFVDTGHIVYAVGTTLFAIPFDVRSLRTLGPPVTLLRGVGRAGGQENNTGAAFVAISKSGDFAYIPDNFYQWTTAFVDLSGRVPPRVDLSGRITPLTEAPLWHPRVSPDGLKIVGRQDDAWWIYSVTGRAAARRIGSRAEVSRPLWTPDGTRIVFRSRWESGFALVSRSADGAGSDELLLPIDGSPVGWSPDGKTLFYLFKKHVWSWMRGDQPRSLATIDAPYASLSPDADWVAFHVEDGGTFPYIQSLSNPAARFRISADGGYAPLWSPDGRTLFYVSGDRNSLIAVDVRTRPTVAFGAPVVLIPEIAHGPSMRGYDITPDGRQLFVGFWQPGDPRAREIRVILNWTEELKRLAPSPLS